LPSATGIEMVWDLLLRCRNIRVTGFANDADGRQRGAYPRLPPWVITEWEL